MQAERVIVERLDGDRGALTGSRIDVNDHGGMAVRGGYNLRGPLRTHPAAKYARQIAGVLAGVDGLVGEAGHVADFQTAPMPNPARMKNIPTGMLTAASMHRTSPVIAPSNIDIRVRRISQNGDDRIRMRKGCPSITLPPDAMSGR